MKAFSMIELINFIGQQQNVFSKCAHLQTVEDLLLQRDICHCSTFQRNLEINVNIKQLTT